MENVSPQTHDTNGPAEGGEPGEEAVGSHADIVSPRSVEPATVLSEGRSMSIASGR